MKLKERLVAWLGIVLVCCLFLVLHLFSPRTTKSVHGKHDNERIEPFLKSREVKLSDPSGEKVERSGLKPVKTLQDLKAHLVVMRKDLDMSNYSSNGEHNLSSASKKQKLQDYILKDNVFRDNADEIAEIAEILKDNGVVKQSQNASTENNPPKEQRGVQNIQSSEKAAKSAAHAVDSVEVPYRTFPHYNAQDERMKNFHFPSAAFKTLTDQMEKYHQSHKKHSGNKEPTLLKNPYKAVTKYVLICLAQICLLFWPS